MRIYTHCKLHVDLPMRVCVYYLSAQHVFTFYICCYKIIFLLKSQKCIKIELKQKKCTIQNLHFKIITLFNLKYICVWFVLFIYILCTTLILFFYKCYWAFSINSHLNKKKLTYYLQHMFSPLNLETRFNQNFIVLVN